MGEVWLARQTAMDRFVALKLLSREFTLDSSFVDRFMKEVKISAKMDHPNIVTAFDAGRHGDIHYLAMSYVDGRTLEDMLEENGVLPERDALEIIRDVARALRYAWEEFEIIHRDIKPANIMIDRKGVAKLMDMGISKSVGEEASLTMTGTIIGTPYYMSPEQGMGERDLDFRSDIYSLGATLYHLVTGTVPFDAGNALGIVSKHITEPLPSPLDRNADLSEGCVALLVKMMEKDRSERHSSWGDVVDDMERVSRGGFPGFVSGGGAGLDIACEDGVKGRFPVFAWGALGAFVLGLGAVLGILFFGGADTGGGSDASPVSVPSGPSDSCPDSSAPAVPADTAVSNSGDASASGSSFSEGSKEGSHVVSTDGVVGVGESGSRAEMWDFAMDFAKRNEGRFDLVISNFERIRESLSGTKYELMANAEIEKLKDGRKKASERVLKKLAAKASEMSRSGDYSGAAKFLREYSGEYASETGEGRLGLAVKYEKEASAVAEKARREEDARRLRVDGYLLGVVSKIASGRYQEALGALSAPGCPESPAVGDLRKVAEELSAVDAGVLKSFSKEVGKSVAIATVDGLKVYRISRVRNGKVYYSERNRGAVVQKPLDLKSLAISEKVKRGGLTGLSATVLEIFGFAERKNSSSVLSWIRKLPATPAGQVFKDALMSNVAKKAILEALRKLGVERPTLDAAVVGEKLRGLSLPSLGRRKALVALEAFKRRFGDTFFSRKHADLLAVLEKALTDGVVPDVAGGRSGSAAPLGGSVSRSGSVVGELDSPEALKEALRKINPDYDGSGMFRFRNGRCVGVVLHGARGVDGDVLRFLSSLPLMGLDVSGTEVSDLSPLSGMERLRMLNVSRTRVGSLGPLKGLGLFNLDISRTGVSDLTPLADMPLRELRMVECPIKDYKVLSTLSALKFLMPEELWRKIPGKEGARNATIRRPRPKSSAKDGARKLR
jgi:serine/threonine-protein kinase